MKLRTLVRSGKSPMDPALFHNHNQTRLRIRSGIRAGDASKYMFIYGPR